VGALSGAVPRLVLAARRLVDAAARPPGRPGNEEALRPESDGARVRAQGAARRPAAADERRPRSSRRRLPRRPAALLLDAAAPSTARAGQDRRLRSVLFLFGSVSSLHPPPSVPMFFFLSLFLFVFLSVVRSLFRSFCLSFILSLSFLLSLPFFSPSFSPFCLFLFLSLRLSLCIFFLFSTFSHF